MATSRRVMVSVTALLAVCWVGGIIGIAAQDAQPSSAAIARAALVRLGAAQQATSTLQAPVASPSPGAAGTAPTVVSSSAAQSPQEQCLLAQLAAANPSAFRSAALAQFNTTDCSTLSTALAPSVAASAGPAVNDTQAGPLGIAELGAGGPSPATSTGNSPGSGAGAGTGTGTATQSAGKPVSPSVSPMPKAPASMPPKAAHSGAAPAASSVCRLLGTAIIGAAVLMLSLGVA